MKSTVDNCSKEFTINLKRTVDVNILLDIMLIVLQFETIITYFSFVRIRRKRLSTLCMIFIVHVAWLYNSARCSQNVSDNILCYSKIALSYLLLYTL